MSLIVLCFVDVQALSSAILRCSEVFSSDLVQPRTQTSQALWQEVGRLERLWGTGILLPQYICGKTMQTVTRQPIKKYNFF